MKKGFQTTNGSQSFVENVALGNSFHFFIIIFSLRYDDEDYNQFAPRDPWADLSTKQSAPPVNSMAKQAGGNHMTLSLPE